MSDDRKICRQCRSSNEPDALQCEVCAAPFGGSPPPASSGTSEAWTMGCLIAAVLAAGFVVQCFGALNNIR